MKIRDFIFVLLLTLILFLPAFGQHFNDRQETPKIVFINRYTFLDRDKGIIEYISADRFCLEICRFGITKREMLEDELENNDLGSELRAKKEDELKKLEQEDKEFLERRRNICIAPVLEEIARAQSELEKGKKLVILDLAELVENWQILALDEKTDITAAFTEFFNNRKKSGNSFKAEIPDSKIGVINKNVLIENNVGVGCLVKRNSDDEPAIENCKEFWKNLQDFAFAKGFNIIFDSGKPLPEEVQNFAKTDITEDFILHYSRNK